MKTAICANYKPTDTLSARGFMSDLPPDGIPVSVQSGINSPSRRLLSVEISDCLYD